MKIVDNFLVNGYYGKKLKKIKKKIEKKKKVKDLYVVTMPLFKDGWLEIYIYNQLFQPLYEKLDEKIVVVGLASNKYYAYEMIQNIVQDMLDKGMELDAKKYFMS